MYQCSCSLLPPNKIELSNAPTYIYSEKAMITIVSIRMYTQLGISDAESFKGYITKIHLSGRPLESDQKHQV